MGQSICRFVRIDLGNNALHQAPRRRYLSLLRFELQVQDAWAPLVIKSSKASFPNKTHDM